MAISYILSGGNLGNRALTLAKATELIALRAGNIVATSQVYETAAWGVENQPSFLNQVLQLDTSLPPLALLRALQQIELDLGRKRKEKWHARTIDLDILFYEDHIIDLPELQVPHPELHKRNFTLVPLAEIADQLQHPNLRRSIGELLANSPDHLAVKLWGQAGSPSVDLARIHLSS